MVEAMLALTPHPFGPDYRVLVETLARYQSKRALVVVLTDFVEGSASRELEAWLAVLARRHCVMLVALRDRLLAELDQPEPGITRGRGYRRPAPPGAGAGGGRRSGAVPALAAAGPDPGSPR